MTAADLATAVKDKECNLVLWRMGSSSEAPTYWNSSPYGGGNTVVSGGGTSSRKWEAEVVPLQFRPPKLANDQEVGNSKERQKADVKAPVVTHEIRLQGGRTMRGRLVSKTFEKTKFVIVVGGIESQTEFATADVIDIIELAP